MQLKFLPALLLFCLALMAGTCKKKSAKETMEITNALMGKTWLHSHEEDHGDTLVFRPNSYDFPPSRGRIGFLLEANGNLKQYDIAPTDGLEEKAGKWQMNKAKTLEVSFPEGNSTNYEAEIISAETDKLEIKRRFK